ncbi:hypothetical protein [Sporosarcina highlanderae]|uniref:RNA polymerase sigma factor 70 region 4 type 2 domain-containing protein n=1 Tax=Sporosarcina highlanderae TaxID=3035916 RepID=A0ABT8JVB7_9BACL|nr:hypothetical protein [Sporosarcina highlanderae]MDN4609090.1 hypothetical protein [Sporosarcina highlanderae]
MESLEDKVILGDIEAFKVWMNLKIRPIELFAVQYGLTQKEAGNLAETIFKNLYGKLNQLTEDQLQEKYLFESAIQLLNELQSEIQPEEPFPFKEDNKLHHRVFGLPPDIRVPFILSIFHGNSTGEIADILDLSELQVQLAIDKAYKQMTEPNLEKKLEFLGLSYQRLTSLHNEMNIFISDKKVVAPEDNKSITEKRKRPMLLWGIGVSILAMMLLVMTITKSEAYQQSAADKFIEKSKDAFFEELDRNKSIAGLPSTELLRSDVYLETYGEDTRRKFDWFTADLKDQVESGGKFDKKKAQKDFDILMQELLMPSEMVKNLTGNPLVNDYEKSMEFLDEYVVKISTLLRSYGHIISQNEAFIREIGRNDEGRFDQELFFSKKSSQPLSLQKALDGMESQGMVLDIDASDDIPGDYIYIYPIIDDPDLSKTLQDNLHPDIGIYITILMRDLKGIHEWTVENQADLMLQIEKGLFQSKDYERIHSMVFSTYNSIMYLIIRTEGNPDIYDSNGTVSEEYRKTWTQIANNGEDSPSAQIMKEIVEEMESSGWTFSLRLNRLQYYFTLEQELRKKLNGDN